MPFIPAKSVQSGGFTSASDAILNSQNKTQTPNTSSSFGGAFNPQSDSTLGQIDKTLSSGTGVLGGAASGIYTAAKGLATLGKDVAVDTFNTVNHPLDSIGKAYDFAKNEAVNQGAGNENTDTVGKLVQSTVGSKGFMGVGQEIANYANDKLGRSDKSFSGGKLTGDVINSVLTLATAGGGAVTADSLKFAAGEALQNGVINQTVHDFLLKQAAGIVGKYLAGGTIGAGFQAASNLQEGAPVTQNLDKAFYAGGGVPVVLKGVSSTMSGANTLKNKITGNSAVTSENIDTLAGTITQGKKADIATAKKALANVDVSGVKTYDDLASVLNNKINETKTVLDSHLLTNTERKPLDQLTFTHKVGDAEIAHNYVTDSLNQLEDHYKAINDQVGVAKITQLREKAGGVFDENGVLVKPPEGLTAKEVNDLARVHGQELNAFNANGQAASGLSKQAAENTRTGLKETAKSIFKDELFNTADKEMANLIRTRDLVQNVGEKVNQLKQRIQERSLGAKVGVALGKTINLLSLGTAKGIVEALIPRGQGFKVMNALDLESTLKGNLEKLQKAMDGKTEAEILNNLNSIQASKDLATSKNAINSTNSNIPAQSTPSTPKSKGIRGMINLDYLPTLKAQVKSAEKSLSEGEKMIMTEQVASTLNKAGIDVGVVTKKNYNDILERAKFEISDTLLDKQKKDMSTPFVKQSQERLGDTKKKVVSDSVTIYKGLSKEASNNPLGSFTTDINHAKRWTKGDGVVVERTFKPDTKFADYEDYHKKFMELKNEKDTDAYFKAKGYDGVDFRNSPTMKGVTEKEIRIWNPEKLSKVASTLEQEAKKYKSAEEFVKAQGTLVYHGTKGSVDIKNISAQPESRGQYLGNGIYFTKYKEGAELYGGKILDAVVNEKDFLDISKLQGVNRTKEIGSFGTYKQYLKNNSLEDTTTNFKKWQKNQQEVADKILEMGYKGVTDGQQHVIFDKSTLKTKAELIDIWNRNNK